jgi:cytochrome c oxidase subunit 4
MSQLEHQEHEHPGPRQYVVVAIVLAVITAIEVAIYYIDELQNRPLLFVLTLLAFSLIKFSLVVRYFMHLKFDSKLFTRLFVTGLILALAVFAIVLGTFFGRGGPSPGVGG